VHGANGYLLDEFLRDGANRRSGPYGGPLENRARLLLEVLDATCAVWGADRVGLRISPLNSFNSMVDSDPVGLVSWLAKRLNAYKLAYLHVMRADFLGQQKGDVLTPARQAYEGVLIGNMGYSPIEAASAVESGQLDAVAFGVPSSPTPTSPPASRPAPSSTPPTPTPSTPAARPATPTTPSCSKPSLRTGAGPACPPIPALPPGEAGLG
jgi:N-ethylmaleimide reductase